MKVFDYIDRLKLFNKLVEEKRTGTPEEFANQLGIKRRTLYKLVDELKSHDIPIAYSRVSKTFYYTRAVDLKLECKIKLLDKVEIVENNGGFAISNSPKATLY